MSDQAILRITREIKQIQQGADMAFAVDYEESDIRNVRAVILGPPDTPYQFGFYEFTIKFGKDYPTSPPTVRAVTTNGGACRFGPNLYAGGKVCLSILGTWNGERGEQWSSAQGLESVLISIQSLMSSNPYENEPGYENAKSESDRDNMVQYNHKICHETIRIAVIQPLEMALDILPDGTMRTPNGKPSDDDDMSEDEAPGYDNPFIDLRKRRLLWYYEAYTELIDRELTDSGSVTASKRPFHRMPFESGGNTMDGHFDYPELSRRLALVRQKIMEETENWRVQGLQAHKDELGIAVNLQRQYEQIVENLKGHKNYSIELSLVGGNPFLWKVTYFGRPTTPLEGGIIKARIHLSPRFPEEQPRVFLETPLSHVRVSKEGVLCYFPRKIEEMRNHVESIVAALEEDDPPYDPRTTVNHEASKLFWGSLDDRKKYKRTLRRDVERSVEDAFD
ncbi:ubiquitin-conjugating enzyme/RWD-like protein [Aspergillus cavernicola]|uniref:Ubiquitin-conjugating enzyme/RWD-like protein n=1 Tax=Aspergillus cavernicola TaxID=176166 RepID=A0ABR4HPL7_9EURO